MFMKKMILWLAKTFNVCIEREVIKEVVKKEIVTEYRYLGGKVEGDVSIEGDLLIVGNLKVTGSVTIKKR